MKWEKPGKPKVTAGPPTFTLRMVGGPLNGVSIKNHSSDDSTLCFTLNGETGRYLNGKWRPENV